MNRRSERDLLRLVYAKYAYRFPVVGPIFERIRTARARQERRQYLEELTRYRREGKGIVHFLHIGKTGGTAVKEALRHYTDGEDYVIALHLHHWRLRDVPVGERVMFFLRDPISRYMSGFLNQQRHGLPRYFSAWTEEEGNAFRRFSTPNELALALSSDDPAVQAAAVRAMKSIKHVRSSIWNWFGDPSYFTSRLEDILFIGFQERLEEDFERLKVILRLPASVRLPSGGAQAHRNPHGHCEESFLDDKAKENLRAWYRSDYEFLNLCRTTLGVVLPPSIV